MPQFISQALKSSVTPRALARTQYLASVRPIVAQEVINYHGSSPDGTEYTLAAFAKVGEAALCSIAKVAKKSLNTVKKDFGLFVAQVLVATYGPTRVQTYRADDDSAASQRVTGWPELQWVSTYCPHRIVTPAERIVLDTCVVREDTLDLKTLQRLKGDHPVSLSDAALIELVYWMRESKTQRRPAFPAWPTLASQYNAILDPDMPVAPGGHELAALAGLRDFEPGFSVTNLLAYSQEVWRFLYGIKKRDDLDSPHEFILDGKPVTFNVHPASPTLKAAGDRWAALADKTGTLLREAHADSKKVSENELKALFLTNLSAAGDIRSPEKLDLVLAAVARRTYDAAYRGYSPKPGVSNQALDSSMLFAIPLPAVVCTSDMNLINFVRQLSSPDKGKVMMPDELFVWLATGKLPA